MFVFPWSMVLPAQAVERDILYPPSILLLSLRGVHVGFHPKAITKSMERVGNLKDQRALALITS
jgi:hypothetical protein